MSMKRLFIVRKPLQKPLELDFVASWPMKTIKNPQKPSKTSENLQKTMVLTSVKVMYVEKTILLSWINTPARFWTRLRSFEIYKNLQKPSRTFRNFIKTVHFDDFHIFFENWSFSKFSCTEWSLRRKKKKKTPNPEKYLKTLFFYFPWISQQD